MKIVVTCYWKITMKIFAKCFSLKIKYKTTKVFVVQYEGIFVMLSTSENFEILFKFSKLSRRSTV